MYRWQHLEFLRTEDSDNAPAPASLSSMLFDTDSWLQREWDDDQTDNQGDSRDGATIPVEKDQAPSLTDHDLLSREQEQALARTLQQQFEQLAVQLAWPTTQDMDRDALLEAAKAASQQKADAALNATLNTIIQLRNEFVTSNIRLVYFTARRYLDRGMELDDMVQEGILGLMRAAIKFDANAGVRFSTYAYWWIQQAIRQAISKQRSLIRYPANITTQVNRLYGFMQRYRTQTGARADIATLSAQTGLPATTVEDLLRLTNLCVSANAPLHDDGDGTLQDLLTDNDTLPLPDQNAERLQLQQHIHAWLQQLDRRAQCIVRLKYGIGYRKTFSLDEIAPQMGVTRERVRQILDEALGKLRALPDITAH